MQTETQSKSSWMLHNISPRYNYSQMEQQRKPEIDISIEKSQIYKKNSYLQAMKALQEKVKQQTTQLITEQKANSEKIQKLEQINASLTENNQQLSSQLKEVIQEYEVTHSEKNNATVLLQQLERNYQSLTDQAEMLQTQVEVLQKERMLDLAQQKERSDKLYGQIEQIRSEKIELESYNQELEKQLDNIRINLRNGQAKAETEQISEIHRIQNVLNEYQSTANQQATIIKHLEKRVQSLIDDKAQLEQDFKIYRERLPAHSIEESQQRISFLEQQLDDRVKFYQNKLEEAQQSQKDKDESYQKRFQEFLNSEVEFNSKISKLNLEVKELKFKNESLEKSLEEMNQWKQKIVEQKAQLEEIATQRLYENETAHKFKNSYLKYSEIERYRDSEQRDSPSCNSNPPEKKRIQQFRSEENDFDSVNAPTLKELNIQYQKYDQILKQAQKENDFKVRAKLRSDLLSIAEIIRNLQSDIKGTN